MTGWAPDLGEIWTRVVTHCHTRPGPFAEWSAEGGPLGLATTLVGRSSEEVIAVTGEDRLEYAGAFLAAWAGGPKVLVPYASSCTVLAQAAQVVPFSRVLGAGELPETLTPLSVTPFGAKDASSPPPGSLGSGPGRAPEEPLWGLYTGGSTGKRQVWWKSAANLLGEAEMLRHRFGVSKGDVILATVLPNHIYGFLFSVLLPLVSGARVLRNAPFYPEQVVSALEESGATVLVSVPAHYRALRDAGGLGRSLRLAFSSAAPLDAEDARSFYATTGVAVTEVYGSTETGGIAVRRQAAGEEAWTPFDPVSWRIQDDVLCVDSPFLSRELERLKEGGFMTGDRAALAPDGQHFLLLGRCDGVVKVAGIRVDLRHVEERLRALPGVEDACVVAREVPGVRGQGLIALVVGDIQPTSVRRQLGAELAAAAVPRVILRVDAIPVGRNGKRERETMLQLVEQKLEGLNT
jgi:acyl-coenzyme A synthetase/AMP-(fatty) acid ligase